MHRVYMTERKVFIAVYSRKSKFTGKGESIENQIELCREYIRIQKGEEAVKNIVVYEDEGFSGGNLNRPGFKKMMTAARNRELSEIIVYRLDRISRNIGDFSGLIEELSRLGIAFVSIREQFDTATPMGRAMMYIASVFSQLERETIAERIRDNMHELAKTGRWLGGVTPLGYRSEAVNKVCVDGKIRKICKLKAVKEEQDLVLLIFQLYMKYDSLTAVEAELMRQEIKTRKGKYFTRFSIKGILQNPVYMAADLDAYQYFTDRKADLWGKKESFDGIHGMIAYNRTDQEKGRTTMNRPVDQWIITVGEHVGLISGRNWVRVQNSLERNKLKNHRKPRMNEALLTGILYCSCHSKMYPKLTDRKTHDGKQVYTYICKSKERSHRKLCEVKNVSGNALDTAVWEEIKKLSGDPELFVRLLKEIRKFYMENQGEQEQNLRIQKKNKEEQEAKMERLIDSLADLKEEEARRLVEKRIKRLGEEIQKTKAQIRRSESLVSCHTFDCEDRNALCKKMCEWKEMADQASAAQKRECLRQLIQKVIWNGSNARVVLAGDQEKMNGSEDSK